MELPGLGLQSPGLSPTRPSGASTSPSRGGSTRRGRPAPRPSSWSRSRSRPREAGSRLPSIGPGRCHWSQAVASALAPTPGDSARNTPPLHSPRRRSAARAAAPCLARHAGTCSSRPHAKTHASCGGENSNPQATTRGQDRAVPVIQEGPLSAPGRPRGRSPNRSPAGAEQMRLAAHVL